MSSARPRAARRGAVCAEVPGGGVTRASPPAMWIRATSASSRSAMRVIVRYGENPRKRGCKMRAQALQSHALEGGRRMIQKGTSMPTTMILRQDSEFHSLRPEWNDLLASSTSDVPFLRHAYLETWWASLGGGEWPGGELGP